jgi:hypothetical protein
MFDRTDLKAAEEAGVLSRTQAQRLEAFLNQRADPAAAGQSENLRFLSNFNDIFITIGIVILAMGLTALTSLMFGGSAITMATKGQAGWFVALILAPVAALMWLMAEYFSRRRRLVLPSMALVLIFTIYSGLSFGAVMSGINGLTPETIENISSPFQLWTVFGNTGIAAFCGSFVAAVLAFWRFRLPFTLLLIALLAAGAFYTFTGFFGDIGLLLGGMGFIAVGVITLIIAIWFDAKDPQRLTRSADHAFWLHVAAAPQIIWGLRSMITGSGFAMPGQAEAFLIIITLVAISILSVALDRRALIAAGLVTLAMALGTIVESFGGGVTETSVITLLLLGTSIVLLGGGWRTARKLVLSILPSTPFTQRIFPPEPA